MSSQNKSDRTRAILAVLALLILIVVAVFFGLKWMDKNSLGDRQPDVNKQEPTAGIINKLPIGEKPSIDYADSQDLMDKRKAELRVG